MSAAEVEVKPISGVMGAEISGVDLAKPLEREVFERIHKLDEVIGKRIGELAIPSVTLSRSLSSATRLQQLVFTQNTSALANQLERELTRINEELTEEIDRRTKEAVSSLGS